MNYRQTPLKTTEFMLVAECCRWNFAGANSGNVPELAAKAQWQRLLQLCRRHRVQGLVWRCLQALQVPLSKAVATSLSADATNIAQQNLCAARQSALLVEAFDRAGIPLLFIKGLTVGKLAYSNPFAKMSWDIDILVDPDQLLVAATELQRLGYTLVIPASRGGSEELRQWHRRRKESVWQEPRGLTVELHTRLADNPLLLPQVGIHSPRQLVGVAPAIALPTLGADELFAYLCVHGASSAWFRLKWITDFAALLEGCSKEQVGHLYRRSQGLGAGRSAAQALLLASQIYGTRIDRPLRARLEASPINRWLASTAAAVMAGDREPTEARFGTTMIHLTQFFLRPGVRFKLAELGRQIADAAGNRI